MESKGAPVHALHLCRGDSIGHLYFKELAMNELIKIESVNGIESVSARDLWTALGSKQEFANWIKSRLDGFEAFTDFTVDKIINGKATQMDYYLTIDTAKHLAMIERNDVGKKIRQYFIEIEKQSRQSPKKLTGSELMAAALIEAQSIISGKDKQIEAMKPAAQFYADVTGSRDAISIADASKIIGMGYGQNKLFELLRDFNVLMANNTPYQKYIDMGWFRVIEQKYDANGETKINIKTLVFQKGIDGIIKMIRSIKTANL